MVCAKQVTIRGNVNEQFYCQWELEISIDERNMKIK